MLNWPYDLALRQERCRDYYRQVRSRLRQRHHWMPVELPQLPESEESEELEERESPLLESTNNSKPILTYASLVV